MRLLANDICSIISQMDGTLTQYLKASDTIRKKAISITIVASLLGEVIEPTYTEARFEFRIMAKNEIVPFSDLAAIETKLIDAIEKARETGNTQNAYIFRTIMESSRVEGYDAQKARIVIRDATFRYVR